MSEKTTVFIVDDDATALESLAALVRSMGVDFECFKSAEEFLAAYTPNRPGCLVTDLRMKGMSGLDLQAKLSEIESALPVVLVTAYGSVSLAVRAMRGGALTFLQKTCSEHELWQAIKEALDKNVARLKEQQERNIKRNLLATLTEDERKVFDLITQGSLNKQTAQILGVSLRTVEHRRRQVMQKFGVESFAELMRFLD